ncbi:MAG: hypothetical protein H8E38_10975 [SAR324 cluster bacterium]|nr:hypothetical protein [SAR324 cluster bacterium]MBL7036164.1 hypothetical protein [SAR324 cluster bacterium]
MILFFVTGSSQIYGASFPILPEIQFYHTVGSRGSNYSTGALGLSLHLYDEPTGPGRYLHLLALNIPAQTAGWKSKVGDLYLGENGTGFEIGVHDQWQSPAGKGATLTLRKISWPKVLQGAADLGEATTDVLHMGWSWITGTPIITVWLMGLDIASLNLPHDRKLELQFALGLRTAF